MLKLFLAVILVPKCFIHSALMSILLHENDARVIPAADADDELVIIAGMHGIV